MSTNDICIVFLGICCILNALHAVLLSREKEKLKGVILSLLSTDVQKGEDIWNLKSEVENLKKQIGGEYGKNHS